MSDVKEHVIQAVSSTIILYPFIGADALTVGASVVLIDVDHAFEYVYSTGRLDLPGIFRLRDLASRHMHEIIALNLFHTVECYIMLFVLGSYTAPIFFYILAGFIIHHCFDQVYLARLGHPFVRAFSIFEYMIRSRRLITMKQLAQKQKF